MKTGCSRDKFQGENAFHALLQPHATEFTLFVVHNTPVSNLLGLHIFILKYQICLCIHYFWIVYMCINYTWSYVWCILIILLSINFSYPSYSHWTLSSSQLVSPLLLCLLLFLFLVHQWIYLGFVIGAWMLTSHYTAEENISPASSNYWLAINSLEGEGPHESSPIDDQWVISHQWVRWLNAGLVQAVTTAERIGVISSPENSFPEHAPHLPISLFSSAKFPEP